MKIKVVIEETISEEFEVEVTNMKNAYDEIRDKYLNEEIVIENGWVNDVQLGILDKDGNVTDWSCIK